MVYGYARVSSIGQKKHGNSLEDQEQQLRAAGAQEIVQDTFTGTKMNRPNLAKLLAKLQKGDRLIVTKLDRFARTAAEGVQTVEGLLRRGVSVQVLNMGMIDDSAMGKLTLTIMLAFAEFERDMIIDRTQAGKAAAKAKAAKDGRVWRDGRKPKYTPQQIGHALDLLDDGNSYTRVEELTGISKSTLIRARRTQKSR